MAKGKPHFVVRVGMHECLPGFVSWAYRERPLLDLVADLHSLTSEQKERLKDRWMADLNPGLNGAEYAEIDKCWCTIPYTHAE